MKLHYTVDDGKTWIPCGGKPMRKDLPELPVTYCGKTIEEWHESAARDALKLYRLRRDIEDCIKVINDVGPDEVSIFVVLKSLHEALKRSGGGDD